MDIGVNDTTPAGIEREFLAAYDQYADQLFRHCLIRVRDRDLAKDIVQETFTKTWVYLTEHKEITHLRAFLYRVAQNVIVDTVRKRRTTSLDALQEDTGLEFKDESVKDMTLGQQTREVLAALGELDEIYRTAVSMRFIDGLSPREIAEVLSMTENAVSVRIHRGLEKLAARMKKDV